MLEGFLDRLGEVLFNVLVWTLRLSLVFLSVKLTFYLLGMQDSIIVMFQGLKILLLGGE